MAERWLSKQEIADHFGVTTTCIDLWCRNREKNPNPMPFEYIGGRRRFKLSECMAWHRGEPVESVGLPSEPGWFLDPELLVELAAQRAVELLDERRVRSRVRRALVRLSRRPRRALPPQSSPSPSRGS